MVTDSLRQVMLAADGAGELSGADVVTGAAEHPVCGDVVEVDCRLADGRIVEFAWRATACPATVAVAAAAKGAVCDQPAAIARELVAQRVQQLGGLAPTERHALAIVQRALAAAVTP